MSAREFAEWIAYERIAGPIGPERLDWNAAHIACVIANTSRTQREPYKLKDFVLHWDAGARRQTSKEATMILKNYLLGLRQRQARAEEARRGKSE